MRLFDSHAYQRPVRFTNPIYQITVCAETAALRAVLAAEAPVSTPDVHGGFPLHYAAQMCGGVIFSIFLCLI